MKYFYILVVFALLGLSACKTDSPSDNPNNPNNPAPNPANLTASVVKNYTVAVGWAAQSGTVTLERKVADGEFESLGDVTGKTTFEDFPVFDDMTYTYRLKVGSQNSDVSVTVPAVTPNPLSVTLTADAQSVKQTIGKAGGSISATGSNGVVYTLTIPQDALLQDTEITLTPISQIGNLPLSGGLLGAVKIEPEDLEFYNYTTLSMTSTSAIPAGMKAIGFTSSNTGQEFYLYPFAATPSPSVLQAQQDDDDLTPLTLIKGGTYGVDAGTPNEVKKQVQENPPTDPTAQTQQQTAYDDELTPLAPVHSSDYASTWGSNLMLKELWRPSSQTRALFREYRLWLEYLRKHNLEKEFDEQIKNHSKRQAGRISKRFDELNLICEAGDRSVRKEMQELIHWSKLYPALVQNLGSAWFSEAQDRVELCGLPNWEGTTTSKFGAPYETSATIRWDLESIIAKVVRYKASGTVTVQVSENIPGVTCTYVVTNIVIAEDENYLEIDFSTTPPTYSAWGNVRATTTSTCTIDATGDTSTNTSSNTMYNWLTIGPPIQMMSEDDETLAGTARHPVSIASWTWSFTKITDNE